MKKSIHEKMIEANVRYNLAFAKLLEIALEMRLEVQRRETGIMVMPGNAQAESQVSAEKGK